MCFNHIFSNNIFKIHQIMADKFLINFKNQMLLDFLLFPFQKRQMARVFHLSPLSFLFPCLSTGDQTQSLVYARQVLYYIPSPKGMYLCESQCVNICVGMCVQVHMPQCMRPLCVLLYNSYSLETVSHCTCNQTSSQQAPVILLFLLSVVWGLQANASSMLRFLFLRFI